MCTDAKVVQMPNYHYTTFLGGCQGQKELLLLFNEFVTSQLFSENGTP